ncbi:universal stress protein [Flavobacterium pallidum]|uniref:Universal stress protein UspA n=1 Tax=Flavobacterium pallidum TaxID=2172098 RepID=A0A2S1SIS2_9FLAO|nr:universal stress protein [Flavobacterium pallidum]AWI26285.1 universal stress protein UspA [Flavobacterium pallidum]
MKKILFPTDFSESANNAFVYALNLANALKAEIITLHVYEFPILDSNYIEVPLYQAEVYESLELSNFENYKSQIPVLRQIAGANGMEHIPISNVLLEGDLVNNVAQLVKDENIDYVVMGTHGASGFNAFFFGTVTADIMTGTSAFVIGIPEESKFEAISKIGFATAYNEEDKTALRKLIPLADAFDAVIECLHVQTSSEEVTGHSEWKQAFANNNINFHTIESNTIEESIIDFTEVHRIQLFALLNHKHGFWESLFHTSLTKKLAFHLKVPLLALHEK